jgi:hypothetical protein
MKDTMGALFGFTLAGLGIAALPPIVLFRFHRKNYARGEKIQSEWVFEREERKI